MTRIGLLSVALVFFCLQVSALEPSSLWSTYPASRWSLSISSTPSHVSEPLSSYTNEIAAPTWMVEIFARLNYRITVDFKNATLSEAADLMREVLRCNLILSNEALTSDGEFNLRVKAMRGELFLDWMCRLTDAEWEIRDEAIFIYMKSERPRFEDEGKTLEELILEELEKEYVPPDFIPDPFPTENHLD